MSKAEFDKLTAICGCNPCELNNAFKSFEADFESNLEFARL